MSIELNTKSMRLEFDEETGAVYRITALKTGWDIMNSRESGLSWRIMIPLSEELRNNNALGEKQRLSSYQPMRTGSFFGGIEFIQNGAGNTKFQLC